MCIRTFEEVIKDNLAIDGVIGSHFSFLVTCGFVESMENSFHVSFNKDKAIISILDLTFTIYKDMNLDNISSIAFCKANELIEIMVSPKDITRKERLQQYIIEKFKREGYYPVVEEDRLQIYDSIYVYLLFTEENNDVNGKALAAIGYTDGFIFRKMKYTKAFEEGDFEQIDAILEKLLNHVRKHKSIINYLDGKKYLN